MTTTKPTMYDVCKGVTAKDAADKAGIHLEQRGGKAWTNCFLHTDNHASMAFYEDGGFYCFSCHAGGDAVKLYELLYGLPPTDAAKRLMIDFGLASGKIFTRKPVKKTTVTQLKNAAELIRERTINELLEKQRGVQDKINALCDKSQLSEDEQLTVSKLTELKGRYFIWMGQLESCTLTELVDWAAKGAHLDDL